MKLVVDANVIFSALIKNSTTREIILLGFYDFYTPKFILAEIENHIFELEEKTKLNKTELFWLIKELLRFVTLVPVEEYNSKIQEAGSISPDKEDIHYFALALKLNCGIWSNDKILKEQNRIRVSNTKELVADK